MTRALSFRFDGHLLWRVGSRDPEELSGTTTVVLRQLLERAGQLVTREELLEEPNGPNSDNHLHEVVSALRRCLGDRSRGKRKGRIIETAQRRGYRFTPKVRVESISLPNEESRSEYEQGLTLWNDREPLALRRALALFDRARKRHPDFGAAQAARADCIAILATYGWIPARRAAERAADIAGRALRIEGDLAQPHATFGFLRSLFDHRWSEAARDFEESLRRAPGYGTAHHWYALLLAATNDLNGALEQIDTALGCDPDSRVIEAHKAAILYWSRRFDDAEKQCIDAMDWFPDWWYASHLLGLIYAEQGRLDEALEMTLEAVKLLGAEPPMLSATLARVHALRGVRAEAIHALDHRRAHHELGSFHIATAYAALGDIDAAFQSLDRACKQSDAWVSFLDIDPRLDPLREDRRFGKLREQLNLL